MTVSEKRDFRVAVLISGRGSNLEALLKASKERHYPAQIVVVLSDQGTAPGLAVAQAANIPTVLVERRSPEQSKGEFNSKIAEALLPYKPDLVLLAGFMRVVSKEFLQHFPARVINIHPSLLPSFRGLHAQAQALAAGVCFAGCTVHYVVEDVDAGPIIAQAVVPVLGDDDEDSLSARILLQEHQLLPAVVYGIASGQIRLNKENGKEHVEVSAGFQGVRAGALHSIRYLTEFLA